MKKINLKFVVPILLTVLSGCSSEDPVPVVNCDMDGPVLSLVSKEDTGCNLNGGSITVEASGGGEGGYQYSKDGTNFQTSGSFTGLAASSYTITVKSENGCTATLAVQIVNLNGVNIEVSSTEAGCKGSDGMISVVGSGGVMPYEFKLNTGAFQATGNFTGVSQGNNTISAKDANGCEVTQSVYVPSGVSFAGSIQPILTTKCIIPTCHGDNSGIPDWRNFSTVQANAQKIKDLTASKAMPKTGSLTQEQIDLIGCWVDDGALGN